MGKHPFFREYPGVAISDESRGARTGIKAG